MLNTGEIQCWGDNTYGQLGNGTTANALLPTLVNGLGKSVHLSSGTRHTCALLASGTIQCWGDNAYGQLGNGTTIGSRTPVTVTGVSNALALSSGRYHTCAVLATGSATCWGDNALGQLGNGTTIASSTPGSVSGIGDAVTISSGTAHTCILTTSGNVSCWGRNSEGQLGNNTRVASNVPVPVSTTDGAVALSAHGYQSCMLSKTSTVSCWGNYLWGTSRVVTSSSGNSYVLVPKLIEGFAGASEVSVGDSHTCVASSTASDEFMCWGVNASGELGNGTLAESVVPVKVLSALRNTSTLNEDIDAVFTWAESTYPAIFFPSAVATEAIAGYRLRFYSGTGTYLAANDTQPSKLLALGPLTGGRILDLGMLSEWTARTVKVCVSPQVLQDNVCVDPKPQSCSQKAVSWTVGGEVCNAVGGVTASGTTVNLNDIDGTTGSANFLCTNGVWGNPTAAICKAAAPAGCGAQSLQWAVAGQSCNADASASSSGQSLNLTDATGTTGAATFTCTNGTWGAASLATCNAAATLNCSNETLNWSQNGAVCSATSGTATSGQSVVITDTAVPTSGKATFVCINGKWGQPSSASCSAKYCAGATLYWSTSIGACSAYAPATAVMLAIPLTSTARSYDGRATANCMISTTSATGGAWSPITGGSCRPK
ncbi:MAG: hypothetical protein IPG23_00295 [Burkholderiales bacterium]|nr:hypothetical protein [Burkholderiales bacterium]